jgi:hypothetical protein
VLLVGVERARQPPLELARLEIGGNSLQVTDQRDQSRRGTQPTKWFCSRTAALQEESIALSEIAATRRGVATGANQMFYRVDEVADAMPREVLLPAIPSLRGFEESELDVKRHNALGAEGKRRWILSVPAEYRIVGALSDYISSYEAEVSARYIPSRREPWYSIVDLPRPQVLVSPLSKNGFKIVLNTAEAVPSNNLFGVTLRNSREPYALVRWLRSEAGQTEMHRLSRRYHGGSYKLEPGDLRQVRVPAELKAS